MKVLVSFTIGLLFTVLTSSMAWSFLPPLQQEALQRQAKDLVDLAEGEVSALAPRIERWSMTVTDWIPDGETYSRQPATVDTKPSRSESNVRMELVALSERHGVRLRGLDHAVSSGWRAELDSGVLVNLGESDLERRLGRYLSVRKMLADASGRRVKIVDMRYTHGLAVTWDDGNSDGTQKTVSR